MGKPELLALCAVLLTVPVGTSWAASGSTPPWKGGEEPFGFEANRGQFEGPAHFVGRATGYTIWLDPTEAVLDLGRSRSGAPPVVVRMALVGGSRTPRLVGREELPGLRHYLRGDPTQWVKDVPSYARVEYAGVYPGIDLVFRGNDERAVEYDFIVAPGADPRRIRMAFTGSQGLRLDAAGDLLFETAAGPVRQQRPRLYQEVRGRRREVAGGFALEGRDQVGFVVGPYDVRRPLVIDPTLAFSTYHGGCKGSQGIQDVAVDAVGNAYVAGYYPWDCDQGLPDAFVSKFSPSGALVFHATVGGQFVDEGRGVAVDAAGNVYLTGSTSSNACCRPFPIVNAIQPQNGGGTDAFIVKLNPTGQTILYSTFYGGSGEDRGADVEVDPVSGRIYFTGSTNSPNFPTANAAQPTLAGGKDAFVAVLNPAGSAVVFSTYLGGSADDRAARLAVSPVKGAFVAGTTASPDFPVRSTAPGGPLQPRLGGGASDAFLALLTPAGVLADATYLGGVGKDEAYGVALGPSGHAFVTGSTDSPDFPTASPLQPGLSFPPEADAFLAKLAPDAASLAYSTFLDVSAPAICPYPSPVSDAPCGGVAVGGDGSAFVTARGVFVTKVDPAGTKRLYTCNGFGGHALALSPPRSIFVAGRTGSYLFPTVRAQDASHEWYEDELGWLTKLTDRINPNARFEEQDHRITYTGAWEVDASPEHSGGTAVRANEAGAKAVITVTGTGLQVIGRRDPSAGILKVSLNGNPMIQNRPLDSYASPAEARSVLVSFSGPPGTYTVTLEATGTHGNRSSGAWVWIDGINVLR